MTQVAPVMAPKVVELHVRGGSDCRQMAGLIGKRIFEGNSCVSLRCVGAASVNQAIKAVAIARRFAALEGVDLRCSPYFMTAKPIRPHRLVRQEQQRTQATIFNENLAETRNREAQSMKPRSQASWSAEQARLGSWRSGLGRFQVMGRTPGFVAGQADPLYQNEDDVA
jgi:stage V sporulation protein SpoVS